MSDPKRVARIYLPTTTVELLESGKNCWMLGMQTEPSERFPIPFEPAVPRCGTCKRFRVATTTGIADSYAYCYPMDSHLPLDGSGYCHEHTEAKHG